MATFDAGSIEARLTLDRSDFNRELDQATRDGDNFSRRSFTASVGVNTGNASAQIDRLEQRLRSLGGGSASVNTRGVDGALAQFGAIQAAADRLDGRSVDIQIRLLGQAEAAASMASLNTLANRLNRTVTITTRSNTSSAQNDMDKLASKLVSASSAVPPLVSAVAGLGPALIPLAGATLALGGGLVAMGAGALGAAGIFGGALKAGIKQATTDAKAYTTAQKQVAVAEQQVANTKAGTQGRTVALQNLAKAQNALNIASHNYTPAERAFTSSLTELKSAFTATIKATDQFTLGPARTALDAVRLALPTVVPVLRDMAPVVQDVANRFKSWMTGGGMRDAMEFIRVDGVPILKNMIATGRDLFGVAGNLVRAFAPFGTSIAGGIKKGADALKGWSDKGGFTNFVTLVRQYMPQIKTFLDNLGAALKQVGTAAAQNGPLALGFATALLKITANTPLPVLRAILIGLALYRPAMLLAAAATYLFGTSQIAARNGINATRIAAAAMVIQAGIVAVASRVWAAAQWVLNTSFYGFPLVWIIAAIAAVIAAIVLIATKTTWFQTAWKYTWNFVKQIASDVWNWLKTNLKTVMEVLLVILTGGGALLLVIFIRHWSQIKQYFGDTWNWIHNTAVTVWNAISTFFSNGWNTLRGLWQSFWSTCQQIFSNTWNTIHNTATSTWGAISGFFTGAWATLKTTWNSLWDGFKQKFTDVLGGIRDAAKQIWADIQSAFKTPINAVIGFYNGGIARIGNDIIHAFGLKNTNLPTIPALAQGGPITGGTPGRDSVPVLAMPGEHMLTTADVNALGGQNGVYAFRQALHMAGGGAVNPVPASPTTPFNPYAVAPSVNNKIPKSGGNPIVNAFKAVASPVVNAVKALVAGAVGTIANPIIHSLESSIDGSIGKVGLIGAPIAGGADKVLESLLTWIAGKDKAAAAAGGGTIPTAQHKTIIDQALAKDGITPTAAWENGMNTLITRESAWNAGAVNRTDSNAAKGTPSQGLAQVIAPTFASYGSGNILNPVDNVAAAINYINAVYGGIQNVQQANASLPPKGYAGGTFGADPGWAWVGERGPELMKMAGGETIIPNHVASAMGGVKVPGYASGTGVTVTGLPGTGTVSAEQKGLDKLRSQYAAARIKTAQETNAIRKRADQAEVNLLSARISAASTQLTQSKQTLAAETKAATASASAVTKGLRSWVDTQLATLKAQLAAADQLRTGYLQAAQGTGAVSLSSPGNVGGLGAQYASAATTISKLTSNVQLLNKMGLSPGIQGEILQLAPADALTYTTSLLSHGGSVGAVDQQYANLQKASTRFADLSANSVAGLNGVQAAYSELQKAEITVNVKQPKTMILSIGGHQFEAAVASVVESEVTTVLAKTKRSRT